MKVSAGNVLLFCVFLLVPSVFAQPSYDMVFGLKFGMNFATFGGNDGNSFRYATGMNIGGMIRKPVTDIMFLQADLILSEKGALDNQDVYREQGDDTVNVEIVWSLNYFEIPVIVGFDFLNNTNSSVHPILYGGAFAGVKTSSKLRGDYEDITTELEYQDAKSLDYGYVIGGSIDFEINDSRLTLDVRFTKSLITFDESEQNWDFKNKVITASIGYFF